MPQGRTFIMPYVLCGIKGTAAYEKMKHAKKAVTIAAAMMALTSMPALAAEGEFDPAGTYHATLGIQTCNTKWIYRPGYFDEGINEYYGTDKNDKLLAADAKSMGLEFAGTFTDAVIAGNGTYIVKLEHADFGEETSISQLHVATDIPENWEDLEVSDVKVTINGKQVLEFEEGFFEEEDKYIAGGMVILCMNHWRNELTEAVVAQGYTEEGNGIAFLKGTGDESIEIQFTLSGFNYDKSEDQDPAETSKPGVSETTEPEVIETEPEVTETEPEATESEPEVITPVPETTEAEDDVVGAATEEDSKAETAIAEKEETKAETKAAETKAAETTKTAEPEPLDGSNSNMFIVFIIVGVCAVILIAVIILLLKKKK